MKVRYPLYGWIRQEKGSEQRRVVHRVTTSCTCDGWHKQLLEVLDSVWRKISIRILSLGSWQPGCENRYSVWYFSEHFPVASEVNTATSLYSNAIPSKGQLSAPCKRWFGGEGSFSKLYWYNHGLLPKLWRRKRSIPSAKTHAPAYWGLMVSFPPQSWWYQQPWILKVLYSKSGLSTTITENLHQNLSFTLRLQRCQRKRGQQSKCGPRKYTDL